LAKEVAGKTGAWDPFRRLAMTVLLVEGKVMILEVGDCMDYMSRVAKDRNEFSYLRSDVEVGDVIVARRHELKRVWEKENAKYGKCVNLTLNEKRKNKNDASNDSSIEKLRKRTLEHHCVLEDTWTRCHLGLLATTQDPYISSMGRRHSSRNNGV
jgi:hypothetical protein